MSKARIMSAGTVGTSKRLRVNGPEGGGNALQGLPPISNMRSSLVPFVRARSDGSDRNLIFCVNQLGGVGAKRGQFGPGNRAGVGKTGGCDREGQYGGRYFGDDLHGNFALLGLLGPAAQANAILRKNIQGWFGLYNAQVALAGGVGNLPPDYEPVIPGDPSRPHNHVINKLSGKISEWDTSDVTDMSNLFNIHEMKFAFNVAKMNISNWDTSNVTSMRGMFRGQIGFGGVTAEDPHQSNYQIGNWDTRNVTDMALMFQGCSIFNVNIHGWNTSKVTNMFGMFQEANSFNPVNGINTPGPAIPVDPANVAWNVSNVTNMAYMFYNAGSFNKPINFWDTGKVTDMTRMFSNAKQFNQDISHWNVSKVVDYYKIFEGATNMSDSNKPPAFN